MVAADAAVPAEEAAAVSEPATGAPGEAAAPPKSGEKRKADAAELGAREVVTKEEEPAAAVGV